MPSIPEFQPSEREPWDRRRAAHLLQRAGFGPVPHEIDRAVRDGLAGTVERLLNAELKPSEPPSWVSAADDPPPMQLTQEERMRRVIQEAQRNMETKRWWLERMAFADPPLREKMTVFWHGHFATETRKVRIARNVLRHNEMLRANALGDFRTLLKSVSRDPAMLRYLDNNTNRKEHPNENYARELMELFSMGVGNYTEEDVKAAARAFTGWTAVPFGPQPGFRFLPFAHDDGEKTFLGRTGNLDGDDIIETILAQPVTARFMAGKLCRFFASEEPDPALVEGLAGVLRENNYQLKPALAALFRSRAFYAPEVIGTQIKSPVQLLVGAWRQLRVSFREPRVLVGPLRLMGQDIMDPPNVKGWDGGRAWINTNTLALRQSLHTFLLEGKSLGTPPGPGGGRPMQKAGEPLPPFLAPDVDVKLLYDAEKQRTPEERVAHFLGTLLPASTDAATRARLVRLHKEATGTDDQKVRALLAAIMQMPEYQLC